MGQPLNSSSFTGIRGQNPQILPTFDPVITVPGSSSSMLGHLPPDLFLKQYPRIASTTPGSITLGGTAASGDVATITITNNAFPSLTNFPEKVGVAITYTLSGTDTLESTAAELAQILNANPTMQQFDFYASADVTNGVVLVDQQSSVGSFSTITAGATGALTLTVNNQIAGGSGPIIPLFNFEFDFGLYNVQAFVKGIPYNLGYTQVAALVNAGYPIY